MTAPVEMWIAVCAWLSLCGWTLAALGHLDRPGYAVALAAGAVLMAAIGRRRGWFRTFRCPTRAVFRKVIRRFRRPLPAIYLLVLLGIWIGGILYPPTNYDGLTYRAAQLLNWGWEKQWIWIESADVRVNGSAPGMTWLNLPWFIFARGDRAWFVWNAIGFTLLPGILHRLFRGAGVAAGVAWKWMWIVPCGWCFALQAGGIGNDFLGAFFALAAIACAFTARDRSDAFLAGLSMLAIALATGVKQTNLPLLLPWLAAIAPALPVLAKSWKRSLAFAFAAAAISFLPSAALNLSHTGNWTGDAQNETKARLANPAAGIVGNGIEMIAANTQPPIWPAPGMVNRRLDALAAHPSFRWVREAFPRYTAEWVEFPTEEKSGLGLGLTALLLLTVVMAARRRPKTPRFSDPRAIRGRRVFLSSVIAGLITVMLLGSESFPRLAAPFYPLWALGILLLPGAGAAARTRLWSIGAILASTAVLPALILSPSRPLWPWRAILSALQNHFPASQPLARAATVYETYANRNDAFAPIRRHLADTDTELALIIFDYPIESLWRPFGGRHVFEMTSLDPAEWPPMNSARTLPVVTSRWCLRRNLGLTLEKFLTANRARVIATEPLALRAAHGEEEWFLIELPVPAARPPILRTP